MQIILLAALLAGCSSTPTLDALRLRAQDDLADLRAFTVQDARQALVVATAAQSLPPMTCLPVLIRVLEARQAAETAGAGHTRGLIELAVVLYLAHHPPAGTGDPLKVACSAWALQMARDVAQDAVSVAGIVGSGGATAPQAAVKVIQLLKSLGVGVRDAP